MYDRYTREYQNITRQNFITFCKWSVYVRVTHRILWLITDHYLLCFISVVGIRKSDPSYFMTWYKILPIVFYNFSLVVGIRKSGAPYFMTWYKILPIVFYNFLLVVGIRKSDPSYFMTWYKILLIVFYDFLLVVGIRKSEPIVFYDLVQNITHRILWLGTKYYPSYFMTWYKILLIVFYNFSLVVGIRKSGTSYFIT